MSALVALGELCRASADFGPLKTHYPQLKQQAASWQWRPIRSAVRLTTGDSD
jgi:hypothetical protein